MIFYRWIFPIILLLATGLQLTDGGTINRPVKTNGSTAFTDGMIPTAADFNGDITTMYADYNGNISNINIASAAAIDGSKITPTFTTADGQFRKSAPCLSYWDTSQLADSRQWKHCFSSGAFTLAPYTDANAVVNGVGYSINRATGLLTFLSITTDAPTGEIKMWGGSSAPTGYIFCDGSAVSRTTYAALFAVIGTTWGAGDGSTTFNVPDFRGRVPIGTGTGTGGGASGTGLPTGGSALTSVSRGTWKGEQTHTMTTGELVAHSHGVVVNSGVGGGVVSVNSNTTSTDGSLTSASGTIGSTTPFNVIQPVMGVNFIIKI